MYNIEFTDLAKKQFLKLPKDLQIKISRVLERIKIKPENYMKKLIRDPGSSLRIRNYRIILGIDKNKLIILILKLGNRKNIYKKI